MLTCIKYLCIKCIVLNIYHNVHCEGCGLTFLIVMNNKLVQPGTHLQYILIISLPEREILGSRLDVNSLGKGKMLFYSSSENTVHETNYRYM